MSFQTLDKPSPDPPRLSYIAMITAVSTVQEPNLPIYGFSSNGYPVYPDKVNSHFLWDVPKAHMYIYGLLMATKTEDPSTSPPVVDTPIAEEFSDDNNDVQGLQTEPAPSVPPVFEKSSRSSFSPWFTFDDIPRHKWQARHQEFATWIDVQMTSLTVQSERVLPKAVHLIQHLQQSSTLSDNEEVESTFSEQFEKVDYTAFILTDSTDSDPDDISVISTIQEINHIRPTLPGPSVKISVIPSKFHKLVSVIDFLDTSAQRSMLNPKILPPNYWDNHTEYFRAANGKVFETSLITKKPIDTAPPYPSISQKFLELCPEDHSHFTHPSPLWKNTQFFIHLPFKLNEDVNPTKATHLGMPPFDLTLAKQECTQLLRQGLIEPTTSYWACQAFYVEKRSELVRGKKRLVIDYQPLNAFFKDDKFPLPKIQSLFIHLPGAKVFSKFDLKAGFWQLGISPEDHPTTAFCIPDAHYQWTVLPFGLKVAPSLFQKAMVKIFSPILHHVLIYIDDILLFSHDHQTHQQLISDFLEIMQTHGIMLSEKKSNIGKEFIDFLGMVLKDDHYHPGPHIAVESLKFPDIDLTKKQIQQFLGIVNYVRDFIPKVAVHTSQLSCMLKKSSPPWGPAQTTAVKQLKKIAQSPPPLKIPTTGQRILQTDASDDFWSAILLDKIVLFATKLVLPVRPTLKYISTPDHAPTLLWTLLEWFSPLTWWRKQLQNISNFHQLDQIPDQEADMFTLVFIVYRPYFQHPQTKDYWTQDMAYEWKTFPHLFRLDHDPTIISTLKAYLLELNNVQPVLTDIHHTSIGPSHTLEILPDTQICTPGSNSNPHGILVREQRPDYTNVLFQDAQDPWANFQSLLQTQET
ncbi:hypothetical protein KPL70_001139 [Citrus sinensis]|nr:hypothetical protein KPL70_001139 [Citrus sinensis]